MRTRCGWIIGALFVTQATGAAALAITMVSGSRRRRLLKFVLLPANADVLRVDAATLGCAQT